MRRRRWDRRNCDAIDDNATDGTYRKCGELVTHITRAEGAPQTIARLDPLLRSDRAVQPSLNELARRGDQTSQQGIVSRGKGVLPGLQPRLDIRKCRQIAKRHGISPLVA